VARTLLVHRRDGNVVPEVAFQTRSPRHHEKSESLKWDHREVDPVTGSFQNHGDPFIAKLQFMGPSQHMLIAP
jgi:hypothetical protein